MCHYAGSLVLILHMLSGKCIVFLIPVQGRAPNFNASEANAVWDGGGGDGSHVCIQGCQHRQPRQFLLVHLVE